MSIMPIDERRSQNRVSGAVLLGWIQLPVIH